MQKVLLTLITVFIFSTLSFSQDTILYLSGDKELIHEYTFDDKNLTLNYLNKRGKKRSIEYDFIFSVIDSTGNEKVIFKESIIDDQEFTVAQMRSFINGEIAGRENHKAIISTASGVVFGSIGGALFAGGMFIAPIIPLVNTAVVGSTKVSEKGIVKKFPEYSNDKYFIKGYQVTAKEKRLTNSLIGGFIGLIIGTVSVGMICN